MKVEKRDGSQERRILIGMIVDSGVLSRIAAKWKPPGLFRSQWSNIIGTWCVDFDAQYGKAPMKALEGIFEAWAEDNAADKDTVKLIERFLDELSGEYAAHKKQINSDFLVDQAGVYFEKVALEGLVEKMKGDLDVGKVKKAKTRFLQYEGIELGMGEGVDLLTDEAALRKAFEDKKEPLIRYPGALENFFGEALERDGFVSFMGPEKRGKTWWMLDMAWRAMLQGRRVAFFEVGDLSQSQILRRFAIRASGRPLKATEKGKPIKVPRYLDPTASEEDRVRFKEMEFKNHLTFEKSWEAFKRVAKQTKNESLLKISVHPNSSISVAGVHAVVSRWIRSGWIPDVIVIDYADILAPLNGGVDSREQINQTWKALRSMSQSLHCLVITATQSDSASYDVDVVSRKHFSEDKRKLAHTTGMIGINQSKVDKQIGVYRLNWVVLREGEFSEDHCVHTAGSLSLANPAIISSF